MNRICRISFVFILAYALPYFKALSQSDSILIDTRDGQKYQTKFIAGQLWMLENLSLKTQQSFGIPDTLKKANPDFRGRWYHKGELSLICPEGWRLPSEDDWINYFNYLSDLSDGSYDMETWKADYHITSFNQHFDLFEAHNPLQIIPAGIYEGDKFIYAPGSADYWIMDIKTKKEAGERSYEVVKKNYPGTAHIHLYNKFTQIHSHKHHLDINKPDEIRRFMCRCIKE